MSRVLRVRKRDGREVPFDEAKIEAAVEQALAAVGEEEPSFAKEVARLVALALAARIKPEMPVTAVPTIEDIQDFVERALIELGRARVAKAYILYRDRRARMRDALLVDNRPEARLPAANPSGSGEEGSSGDSANAKRLAELRVLETKGTSHWSKGRIVAALMNEADMERALAEEVASRVEKRVFNAGLQRISTALIRALVDNELVDLGMSVQLQRQGTVGIPRHDLREALEGRAAQLGDLNVEKLISERVLSRFCLEEVLPLHLVESHLQGDLDLIGIDAPQRFLSSSLPAELLTNWDPGVVDAFGMFDELSRSLATTSRGVVIEDCGRLLSRLIRRDVREQPGRSQSGRSQQRSKSDGPNQKALQREEAGQSAELEVTTSLEVSGDWLAAWLHGLEGIARSAGQTIDLSARGVPVPLLRALFAELEAMPAGDWVPRLFLPAEDVEALLAEEASTSQESTWHALLAAGRVLVSWGDRRERYAGPGLRRSPRERAAVHCGAAVALNLPRLARKAGPWREEVLMEEVAALVELAMESLVHVKAFQERCRRARHSEMRGRVMYALAPVGLREALQILGDGEAQPELGARLLGLLHEAPKRWAQRVENRASARGLHVVPTPYFGQSSSRKFAVLDERTKSGVSQPTLFADVGPGELASTGGYAVGWRLEPSLVPTPGDVRLFSTLPSGVLTRPPSHLEAPLLRNRLKHKPLQHRRAAWSAFGAERGDVDADHLALTELGPDLFRDVDGEDEVITPVGRPKKAPANSQESSASPVTAATSKPASPDRSPEPHSGDSPAP